MTVIRKLALVLCLVWPLLSYSNTIELVPGQVYTTNNIVVNTPQGGPSSWTNGVYQNNLTCWSWGDPGYCGPNAIVRPGNNINFSFGQTDLYQSQAIANVLPAATGLRVDGYNFSFTAKNGNGWDNGRVDSLYAYTHLTNTNNQAVFYKTYNLNYKFDWTTFNFSENFTTPFVANELKNVTYGFVGRDNNGWAGPYGPEINNVNFSLKYSVDPCASNPLYSPSCPGYIDAINKLKPVVAQPEPIQTVSVKEPVAEQPVTVNITTTVANSAPTTNAAPTSSGTAQVVTSTPSTAQASQRTSTSPSIGTILSIITGVQAQVSSVERSVVQQAVQEAIRASEKATQEAETVASTQNQQQQESQQTQQNLQSSSVQQTFSNNTRQDFSLLGGSVNQRNNTSLANTTGSNQESFSQNLPQPVSTRNTAPQAVAPVATLPSLAELPQQQASSQPSTSVLPQPTISQQQTQQTSSIYSLFAAPKPDPLPEVNIEQRQVIGPTNLLQQFLDQKPLIENVSQSQQTRSVNQAAQDSELAGQVSLANIARQPQGFQTYLAVLQDVPFYKPTEVYANQRTVDNQRAMRLLSGASEARHRELVDSQYRR